MALRCGLTSVRGNRGENYENEPLVRQKHTKKKKFSLNCLPFAHCANESLSFVRLLTKKQTEVIHLQTD
jgi:hypothetical protein